MYKVFVNEKELLISNLIGNKDKNLLFKDKESVEEAIYSLSTQKTNSVNLYGNNVEHIWEIFLDAQKNIEAAGGVVSNLEDKVLFIKRMGKWDLPKGKIESGESIENAAKREVEEETGINNLILMGFVNKTYHIYFERNGQRILKTTHWFRMNYEGNFFGIPQIEEGITDVSWIPRKKILEKVYPNTFENIKIILEQAFA